MKPFRSTNIARMPSVYPLAGSIEHREARYAFDGLLRRRQPGLQIVVQAEIGEQQFNRLVAIEKRYGLLKGAG
jgi:hypothetical protein